jgi:hypothetical protein
MDTVALVIRALATWLLVSSCSPPRSAPAKAQLRPGAHLMSPAAQHATWCVQASDKRECEDFRAVPVDAVVRFEAQFPSILAAKGFAREARLVSGYERFYWAVLREGRLFVLGTLVCRERLNADGVILLIPICPFISVTFPADAPQQVDFVSDS